MASSGSNAEDPIEDVLDETVDENIVELSEINTEQEEDTLMDGDQVNCGDNSSHVGQELAADIKSSEAESQNIKGEDDTVTTADVNDETTDTAEEPPAKKIKLEVEGIIMLPQIQNTIKFYGRQTELKTLQSAIDGDDTFTTMDVAISGLPGIGKTQLVLQFIQENRNRFKHIIWIDGKSSQHIFDKLYNLALHLKIIGTSFDMTEDENIEYMLESLYTELSQYKTLIVFDNVLDFDSLSAKFLPNNGSNIMFIVTTPLGDINYNLQIKLQGLDTSAAIQMLSDHMTKLNWIDINGIEVQLSGHPLALNKVIKYYEHCIKMRKLKNLSFSNFEFMRLLKQESEMYVKFNEITLNKNYSLLLTFQYTLKLIVQSENGALAIQLLKYMSYMDGQNINIEIFHEIYDINIDSLYFAIELLKQYSLITELNDTEISILSITQFVIRNLCNEAVEVHKLLSILQFHSNDRVEGKTPTIDDHIKPHVMHIFTNYADDSHKKEYALMFLECSYTNTELNYEKIHETYDALSSITDAITIDVKCLYVELLMKCTKYEKLINVTNEIFKNSFDDIEFNTDIYGLLIWYYRTYSLKQLDSEFNINTWKICKNIFIRMSEKYGFDVNTIKVLDLLTNIALQSEDDETYIEYVKDIVKNIIGSTIDWFETTVLLNVIKNGEFFTNIIFHIINKKGLEHAMEYVNDIKSKILIQIEYNLAFNPRYNNIITFLNMNIFICLAKLGDYKTAFETATSTFNDGREALVFLMGCTKNLVPQEFKLRTKYELLKYILNNMYDGIYITLLNAIESIKQEMLKLRMHVEIIELYNALEHAELRVDEKQPCIVMGRLCKAILLCKIDKDIAWKYFIDVFNDTILVDDFKDVVQTDKPESTEEIISYISGVLESVKNHLDCTFEFVV